MNDSKPNREYMSGAPALDRKSCFLRRENLGDSDTLPRARSTSLSTWSTFLVVQRVWSECRLAGCVVCDMSAFPDNFISGKNRGLSQCSFGTESIVVRRVTRSVRSTISCLTAEIFFATGILQQYEMRNGKQGFASLVV